jgi:DNA repair exonuclease SbcCD ATPase subunit
MHIIKFSAENFKKLTAVELSPKGNVVTLTGKNGAGKTSVLDAIAAALCGGDAKKLLRKGEKKGKVSLDLGEFTVTRTFTKEADYLKVETKDGFERKSPQKFLDEIVGRIAFDPMNFINADSKEQRRILVELAGVDLDRVDKKIKETYETRTIEARYLKEAEAKIKGLSFDPDIPETEISAADLLGKLDQARRQNDKRDRKVRELDPAKRELSDLAGKLKAAEELVEVLKKNINDAELFEHHIRVDLDSPAFAVAETEKIAEELNRCEAVNAEVRSNRDYKEKEAEVIKRKGKVENLGKILDDLRTEKEVALKAGKFPVEGLSFNEDGVLFNELPLDQVSAAERVRVALAISMALNPKLRVLRITDGSLLDSVSWKIITEMAEKNDFQVWIEKVDEAGGIGFYFEDGSLKGAE